MQKFVESGVRESEKRKAGGASDIYCSERDRLVSNLTTKRRTSNRFLGEKEAYLQPYTGPEYVEPAFGFVARRRI